jgi:hypothetical protein
MHLVNATLYDHIESTAIYLDNVQKGDIIFASRLLFHRTMPVSSEGLEYYAGQVKQQQEEEEVRNSSTTNTQFLHRYSIRYEPGRAQLNAGWNVEWSVLHDAANAGRSINDIASLNRDYIFYPQVWPVQDDAMGMDHVSEYADQWIAQAKQQLHETLFFTDTSVLASNETVIEPN